MDLSSCGHLIQGRPRILGPGRGLGLSLDHTLLGLAIWSEKGMALAKTTLGLLEVEELHKAMGSLYEPFLSISK